MGKSPTTVYSKTTKPFSTKQRLYIKKAKIPKQEHPFKNYAHVYNVEMLNFSTYSWISKLMNTRLKIN